MTFRVEAQDDGTVEVFGPEGGCWGLTTFQALRVAQMCEHSAAAAFEGVEVGNVGPVALKVAPDGCAALARDLRAAAGRAGR